MNPLSSWWPVGTVYGTLLNFQAECTALAARMHQPPYQAPPKAPVLYVKTANTWSASGSAVAVPSHATEVEVGATVAMVLGPRAASGGSVARAGSVAGYVLMNDLSLPHASFFRPPVKFKCQDGFLGLGPRLVAAHQAGEPGRFQLQVRINGDLRQRIDFAQLVRSADQLLADVGAFMTLREGDVLMLGCDAGRPLAHVGDHIEISAPALPLFGTLSSTLVAEAV